MSTISHYSVIAGSWKCSNGQEKWSEDFMTLSNDFHIFHRYADLQSSAFYWKLTVEQHFKSLANKSSSKNPNSCIFFSIYNPKEVTVLKNLISLFLDFQMVKNPLMQSATIFFCIFAQPLWISFFLNFFFILKSFISSNNTPGRVSSCQISSLLDMYFK